MSDRVPSQLSSQIEIASPPVTMATTTPPPKFPIIKDIRLTKKESRIEKLEAMMRQMRLHEGGLTWDEKNGILVASLLAKFHMLDIEHCSSMGCTKSHSRLYSCNMRAHALDDA